MLSKNILKLKKGYLVVEASEKAVTSISFTNKKPTKLSGSKLTEKAISQLEEFFAGKRKDFDLPLAPEGTAFQKKVWKELTRIPYGKTKSYGNVAKKVGSPNGARAVGGACNKNPLLIVVPCHRVLGASGQLTGFACGLDVKRQLLEVESLS